MGVFLVEHAGEQYVIKTSVGELWDTCLSNWALRTQDQNLHFKTQQPVKMTVTWRLVLCNVHDVVFSLYVT